MGKNVKVIGMGKVKRRIRAMEMRAEDATRVWPRVGSYLSRQVRRQFTTRGAAMGTPWEPLKPQYRTWKVSHGYPRSILVRTGDLRSSFTHRPMDIEHYTPKTGTFGSNDPKAVWHQYGTHRHGKQVNPPRPMLVVTPEMSAEIRKLIAKHVAGKR